MTATHAPVRAPRPVADDRSPAPRADTAPAEHVGLYSRHPWLIPATGIGMTVATFVSMIVLTWAAGGPTPFD